MSDPITWRGWWGDEDRSEFPDGPWVDFKLMAHSDEVGESREATEEDLRMAGYVKIPTGSDERKEDK